MEGVLVTFCFVLVLEAVVAELAAVLLFRLMIPDGKIKVNLADDQPVCDLLQLLQSIELLWLLRAAFTNMNVSL